jgi:hypothetical protein
MDDSAHTAIAPAALRSLRRAFHGRLLGPEDPGYDEGRRIWNGSVDRRPALIAYCTDTADVTEALGFATGHGLEAAVRSGGHSFPGQSLSEGGVVIDLSGMKGLRLDPDTRTARVQAGVLLGELDAATQVFGLAVPAGIVTHTGLAGLTLGGGIGWLMRKYGLTIDQLTAVEMVTAGGERVRADDTENTELFWAVRGGGGNFGIVTVFEFRLNPVGPTVLAGPVVWRMADSAPLLRFYRDWISEAPDDLTTAIVHRRAPAADYVPVELRGAPVVMAVCCWAGPIDRGERFLAPLRRFGAPVLDLCAPQPFTRFQAMFDPSFPHGRWYYFKSRDVDVLTDEVIDLTADRATRSTSPLTAFPIFQRGGALSRVGEDETAFSGRGSGHTFNINATCAGEEGFAAERAWARGFWSDLAPHESGAYVNFLMEEGPERVRAAYGPAKYDRLAAVKRAVDPDNVFHLNQNIPPAPVPAG